MNDKNKFAVLSLQKKHSSTTHKTTKSQNSSSTDQINSVSFAAQRIHHIEHLDKAIKQKLKEDNSGGGSREFQKLPRYMRRRAMNHNIFRLPKHLREAAASEYVAKQTRRSKPKAIRKRKHKNTDFEYSLRQKKSIWMENHIWFAKRFHMIDNWGYKIPWKPTLKSERTVYRFSRERCVLFDCSYYSFFSISLRSLKNTVKQPTETKTTTTTSVNSDTSSSFSLESEDDQYNYSTLLSLLLNDLSLDISLNSTSIGKSYYTLAYAYDGTILLGPIRLFIHSLDHIWISCHPSFSSDFHSYLCSTLYDTLYDVKIIPINMFWLAGPQSEKIFKKTFPVISTPPSSDAFPNQNSSSINFCNSFHHHVTIDPRLSTCKNFKFIPPEQIQNQFDNQLYLPNLPNIACPKNPQTRRSSSDDIPLKITSLPIILAPANLPIPGTFLLFPNGWASAFMHSIYSTNLFLIGFWNWKILFNEIGLPCFPIDWPNTGCGFSMQMMNSITEQAENAKRPPKYQKTLSLIHWEQISTLPTPHTSGISCKSQDHYNFTIPSFITKISDFPASLLETFRLSKSFLFVRILISLPGKFPRGSKLLIKFANKTWLVGFLIESMYSLHFGHRVAIGGLLTRSWIFVSKNAADIRNISPLSIILHNPITDTQINVKAEPLFF